MERTAHWDQMLRKFVGVQKGTKAHVSEHISTEIKKNSMTFE